MNYDFDAILGRLRESMSSGVSTMEGTFAGDILQAVAAELARIWSQEMDTVTQRGFLSTAEGEWLDAVCGNFGLSRKTGESDRELRQRALEWIRGRGASGNAADYEAWALSVEGVAAAGVVPLARGNGTVDVYYVPAEGAEAGLQQRVQAFLEEQRPVGADVLAQEAQAVALNVTATVTLDGSAALETVKQSFLTRLEEYLNGVRLKSGGRLVSLNRIIGLLVSCTGAADVSEVRINGKAENLSLAAGSYARAGTVTLTEEAQDG